MSDWIIIFIVMVIAITMAGLEDERADPIYNAWVERTELRNEELDFETGMKKLDSLWNVIQDGQQIKEIFQIDLMGF